MAELFPIGEYWWLYTSFTGFVLILLGLDLGVFHREAREVRVREAVGWCAAWVGLALTFNAALYAYAQWKFPRDARLTAAGDFDPEAAAWQVALEFFTGYVVEYSLSVDNLFVFLLVLGYFKVPRIYQYRVLFYGILGALVFRGIFITLGAALGGLAVWGVPDLHGHPHGVQHRGVCRARAQRPDPTRPALRPRHDGLP